MDGTSARTVLAAALVALLFTAAPATAHPLRDGLAVTFGQQALPAEGAAPREPRAAQAEDPPLVPTARADCAPG